LEEEDLNDCWDGIHVLPCPHLPGSSSDVSEETRWKKLAAVKKRLKESINRETALMFLQEQRKRFKMLVTLSY
jgi:hypothetical protein